jgi:hypothetical protein
MRRARTILTVLGVAVIALVGSKIALSVVEVPSCHSEEAIRGLIGALKDPALGSLAVNNATTMSGGLLSGQRQCIADIAPLRSNVDASDMHWRHVAYQIVKSDTPDGITVTASLEGATSLAGDRSMFARWVEYFLD